MRRFTPPQVSAENVAMNLADRENDMYYEESVINGTLMFRNAPDAEWKFKVSLPATTINHLMTLTEDERMYVFGFFCTHCGSDNPKCQCWNEE